MAQLKDTLIQGSARVTNTLYADEIQVNELYPTAIYAHTTDSMDSLTIGRANGDFLGKYNGQVVWMPNTSLDTMYLPLAGGTVTGTLTLSKTTDASGVQTSSPALIIGGTASTSHIAVDTQEIMAKSNGTTPTGLHLNTDGGIVYINNNLSSSATTTADNSTGLQIKSIRGTNQPVVRAYSYIQAASGYQWGFDHLVPNLQAGANTCLLTGVANTTNNQGVLEFHYAGSNNAGNYVGLGLYGNNGLLKIFKDKHVEIDTLKIMNQSAVAHLIFTRTGNPSYIAIPDNETLIVSNNSVLDYPGAAFAINKNEVYNAFGGTLGKSSYPWGSLYTRGVTHKYQPAEGQYISYIYYNNSNKQVAGLWYDTGATDKTTKGVFCWREYSPVSSDGDQTDTTGHYETYSLPLVDIGRTTDGSYSILTSKSTITAAQGGTGVTSHTANRLVWSKSATEIQAGYHYANTTKVAINYTSEPTTNFYVGGTAMVNGGTGASSTVGSGQFTVKSGTGANAVAIELYRNSNASWQLLNQSGSLYFKNNFGTDSTAQETYKYTALTIDYRTLDATFGGRVVSNSTDASWINGQKSGYAAYEIADYGVSGKYFPWLQARDTQAGQLFSFGTLSTSFYLMGSVSTRSTNGADHKLQYDTSDGKLYCDSNEVLTTASSLNASNITGVVPVLHGGTGVNSFSYDYVIVGNGSDALVQRGLKITGNVNAAVKLSSDANKTLEIYSGNTLYITRQNGTSIVFRDNNSGTYTEHGRFNVKGMFQLNSMVTQESHKLLVNGDSAFTGKLAFTNSAATLTEYASIQYNNTTHTMNFIVT